MTRRKGGMSVLDILLDTGGDYKISDTGDIILTQSVPQAIKIRLKWFLGEWRLALTSRRTLPSAS